MLPPTTPEGIERYRTFLNENLVCRHRNPETPEETPNCACFTNYLCNLLTVAPPENAIADLQAELEAARARTQTHTEQELSYRGERDRHFNRLLDIQRQVQSCVADLGGSNNRTVSVEEFINIVRRELVIQRYNQLNGVGACQEELYRIQQDLKQLYQLAAAAAREIGIHESSRDFNVQGYIIESANMILALRKEIQQKDVSTEYVQYLQEKSREGARVINQMGEQLRGVWDGKLPGNLGVIPSSVGAIGTRNIAPPITFEAFKQVIWPIYLGLFNSERNLRIILLDRRIDVPEWESAPPRIDSENITYTNRWELAAYLVRTEVQRFLSRVWELYSLIRTLKIPGSEEYWNGPYDDDHGRAIHVHEAMVAAAGRGILAETEVKLIRQYMNPLTDMARKSDLEERHERRFPIYHELQNAITTLTQRIIAFRQLPPAWPEQHERDNSSAEPKRDYELLALMLSRIELEYLSIRVKQLLETVKGYWHLIPHGDVNIAGQMGEELSHAHGARVACEAELTRPSEIAPGPAYPGKTLPPYDAYMPYGRQIVPPYSNDRNNKDRGNNDNQDRDGKGKDKKKGPEALKETQKSNRARIAQMERLLDKQKLNYKKRSLKGNFLQLKSGTSEYDKLKAENDAIIKRRIELENVWKKGNQGERLPAWDKPS